MFLSLSDQLPLGGFLPLGSFSLDWHPVKRFHFYCLNQKKEQNKTEKHKYQRRILSKCAYS
jgi:hypothetical protein